VSNRIYNIAHTPDWMPQTIAVLALDDATLDRLLSLKNCFEATKQFQHAGELYALEIHDRTVDVYHTCSIAVVGEGEQFEPDENGYEDWCDLPPGLEEQGFAKVDEDLPRVECMTLLVLADGVRWQWYEKHCDDLCSTSTIPWPVLKEKLVERCEKCDTPFSQASIDGGRCLGSDAEGRFCGTMVVGVPVEVKE
jgi:hypothetical protein